MPPRRHRKKIAFCKKIAFPKWDVVTALVLVLLLLHLVLMFAGGLPGVFWYYENFDYHGMGFPMAKYGSC